MRSLCIGKATQFGLSERVTAVPMDSATRYLGGKNKTVIPLDVPDNSHYYESLKNKMVYN